MGPRFQGRAPGRDAVKMVCCLYSDGGRVRRLGKASSGILSSGGSTRFDSGLGAEGCHRSDWGDWLLLVGLGQLLTPPCLSSEGASAESHIRLLLAGKGPRCPSWRQRGFWVKNVISGNPELRKEQWQTHLAHRVHQRSPRGPELVLPPTLGLGPRKWPPAEEGEWLLLASCGGLQLSSSSSDSKSRGRQSHCSPACP